MPLKTHIDGKKYIIVLHFLFSKFRGRVRKVGYVARSELLVFLVSEISSLALFTLVSGFRIYGAEFVQPTTTRPARLGRAKSRHLDARKRRRRTETLCTRQLSEIQKRVHQFLKLNNVPAISQ